MFQCNASTSTWIGIVLSNSDCNIILFNNNCIAIHIIKWNFYINPAMPLCRLISMITTYTAFLFPKAAITFVTCQQLEMKRQISFVVYSIVNYFLHNCQGTKILILDNSCKWNVFIISKLQYYTWSNWVYFVTTVSIFCELQHSVIIIASWLLHET